MFLLVPEPLFEIVAAHRWTDGGTCVVGLIGYPTNAPVNLPSGSPANAKLVLVSPAAPPAHGRSDSGCALQVHIKQVNGSYEPGELYDFAWVYAARVALYKWPSHGGSLSANVVTSRKLSFMIPGRNFPPRRPNRRENVNESIRVREVRAVFPDGTAEVMPTSLALRKAQELGLDLVLVSPTAVPPVAKAIDYGHYQYEMKKKQHDARKKQHVVQVKELKFRPNTDDHDYDFKKNHAIRFLKEGNRVKAVVQFRGREIAHTDLGKKLLLRFAEDLATFGAVEGMPRLEGRNAHILISPVKTSVKPEKPEKSAEPPRPN
jgi:translation initiation factor IF-3